jgi:hypothetical protein
MDGLVSGRIWFLTDRSGEGKDTRVSYAQYRNDMTPRLQAVSSCAGVRKSASPGKVVMAFTVMGEGRIGSIYINKARSSQEEALWSCVEERLKAVRLDPPPGGPISVVYTFAFAPPTKMEF